MGLWGAVCSFVSSCVSAVSSAVEVVGKALVTGATKLLELAGDKLDEVTKVIEMIGKLIDVISADDNVDDLGARALQSDKKPEDFDSITEYIEHLKNDIELDKEAFEKADKKEQMVRKAVGGTIVAKSIESKLDTSVPMDFWVEVSKQKMQESEIMATIDTFKENKTDNNFSDYMNGKLDFKDEQKTGDLLVDMYKKLEPDMSIEEIEDKIMRMEAN